MSGGQARTLELLRVGALENEAPLLSRLGRELERRFGVCSRVGARVAVQAAWSGPAGGQWESDAVLDSLIDFTGEPAGGDWFLGLTDADLGAPERDFVFGQATVGGHWALVSTARLRVPGDEERSFQRILKEAVHELGHVAGLAHCRRAGCVMQPSATAADIDRKGDDFCTDCLPALDRVATDT